MGLTEKQKNSFEILAELNNKLNSMYPRTNCGKYICNINKNGLLFKTFLFSEKECVFGIEYANNAKEAQKGCFEDGDLFYFDDYSSLAEMVEGMCDEIDTTKQVE